MLVIVVHENMELGDNTLNNERLSLVNLGGGGALGYFFGWVFAARDSKLAPRSKKIFPCSRIRPKTDTPF